MRQFQGTGTVLKDGIEVASVQYDLTKTVDRIRAGNSVLDGLSSTTGSIRMRENDIEMGDMYMLRLESGTEVQFYAHHTSGRGYPNATYQITVNGDPES